MVAKLINNMRKILFLGLLLTIISSMSLSAQRSNAPAPLSDKLWYGLGFTGNYLGGSFSSTFVIGLAPMVGYKITDNLSFGPRGSALVSFYKTTAYSSTPERVTPTDWSLGVFGRYRIRREFFAQVEYAYQNEAFITAAASGLEIDREVNNAFYVGGGYSTPIGNQLGLEISINYYLNQPLNDFRNPLSYRFGLNYRF